jgi:aquaporin Z
MNPVRSLGPAIVAGQFSDIWIYLTAPFAGAVVAVAAAFVLRGRGGDPDGTRAAQGTLQSPVS